MEGFCVNERTKGVSCLNYYMVEVEIIFLLQFVVSSSCYFSCHNGLVLPSSINNTIQILDVEIEEIKYALSKAMIFVLKLNI